MIVLEGYTHIYIYIYIIRSVAQSCPTLCDPMDCSKPGFPVHHQLPELLKLMPIKSVMPSKHLILCRPLFLLPSIFPSIRLFSKESALHIRWPFPSPGVLRNPGVEPRSPTLQADSLPAEPQESQADSLPTEL